MSGIIQNSFSGLPISELISAPLVATCDAQQKLAESTLQFIDKMFDEDTGRAKTVDFVHQTISGKKISVQAPLISIVNVPSLSVKTCDVSFNMEVRDTKVDKSSLDSKVTTNLSYKSWFSPVKVSMTATVSSKSSSERTTDTSAKYEISVHAEDSGPPEGLSRILDIFESAIPKPSDLDGLPGDEKKDGDDTEVVKDEEEG